jgi:Concanavalin A-like lectin/glucanases superfamily
MKIMEPAKFFLALGLIGLLNFTSTAQDFITNGLVAYYPFNGNANDVSGNGNNGTVVEATLTQDRFGNTNQAYSFNGTNSYISFNNVPTSQVDNWTITAWVSPASLDQMRIAVGLGYDDGYTGNGYSLGILFNQLHTIFGGLGDIDGGFTFPATNQWYQIVMVRNSGVTTFYANGVPTGGGDTTTPLVPTSFRIGSNIGLRFFNGAIDDVRIYNRGLSTNEVAELYAVESPGGCTAPPAGLISWWPAEGNAFDQAGTNNGSLVGPVSFTNGEVGQAFSFDGSSSYVFVTNSTSLNPVGAFSIEGWIYLTNDAPQAMILSKWGDQGEYSDNRSYVLSTISGLGLLFSISDLANQENNAFQQISVNGVLTLNAWIHVAATYDSTTGIRNLYVNGTNVLSNTNTPVAVYNSIIPVTIGAWLRGFGNIEGYFPGLIDELSLYGRALSGSEIKAIYNAGSGGKCNFHPYIPPPRTATGTATDTNGFIVGANITDNGAGYTNTPLVRFIGGGGTGAQAFAVVSNGVVVAINILNPGSGYTNTPVVVIDPPFISNPILGIASISILNFSNLLVGTNYQLQQFQSTTWINQSVAFKATNGFYTTGVVGSGDYRLAQTPVSVQATAFAQLYFGFVVGVLVNNPGSGYFTVPAVTIIPNVGSNATAVASIGGGRVTSIAVTSAGIDYVNPVMVQIDPPPVTAISPAVTSGVALNSSSLAPYDNYQIQFKPDFANIWGNLSGGLFSPTATTNAQYIFLTNDIGFFRLQYVP